MSLLFTPKNLGTLEIPNRLVRSATAERMADDSGQPRAMMLDLYRQLTKGGVGLIITGHMFVHPSGKAHPEMAGIYSDKLVPKLKELTDAVHEESGLVAVQINHGGMYVDENSVPEPIAPFSYQDDPDKQAAREMSIEDIHTLIDAFGQAARRAKEAEFDAVQIHSAHGYLISQFLSPVVNQRADEWGGDLPGRTRFLKEVTYAVRKQVGDEYPVFIKLGMQDGVEGGLNLEESLEIVKMLENADIDGIEISSGFKHSSIRKGIRKETDEAYFLPIAKYLRPHTSLPLMLVGGMRSKKVMEKILFDGDADFISMCRPLINDPEFPNKLRLGLKDKSGCISSNNCWAENKDEGIKCKCPID